MSSAGKRPRLSHGCPMGGACPWLTPKWGKPSPCQSAWTLRPRRRRNLQGPTSELATSSGRLRAPVPTPGRRSRYHSDRLSTLGTRRVVERLLAIGAAETHAAFLPCCLLRLLDCSAVMDPENLRLLCCSVPLVRSAGHVVHCYRRGIRYLALSLFVLT